MSQGRRRDLLTEYSERQRCFSVQDVLDGLPPTANPEVFPDMLTRDARFLPVSDEARDGSALFISKRTLMLWFVRLNVRLAEACRVEGARASLALSPHALACSMSGLRDAGAWRTPPERAVEWARTKGLVGRRATLDEYVFPLARLLVHSPRLLGEEAARLAEEEASDKLAEQAAFDALQTGLRLFSERVAFVVQARAGLLTGHRMTLEEAGACLGLTRARVSQLELTFWKALRGRNPHHNVERCLRPLASALLRSWVDGAPKLLVPADSAAANTTCFLAVCLGIPTEHLPKLGFAVLGGAGSLRRVGMAGRCLQDLDPGAVAEELEREGDVPLDGGEVLGLANAIVDHRRRTSPKQIRVRIALQSIGHPAYYSEVADVCREMWPEDDASDHNTHALLAHQACGVVWTGVRGTYALKDWGYERPSMPLLDLTVEVVNRRYRQTRRPVPFAVIATEVAKKRKLVNPESIRFCVNLNERLRRVPGDAFVPVRTSPARTPDAPGVPSHRASKPRGR